MSNEVVEMESEDKSYNSDEAFNECIEFDEYGELNDDQRCAFDKDAESDKESYVSNRFRSTKEQLQKLDACMEDYDHETDKDGRWNMLTKELNEIGPVRSIEKWKRIWAARKYNLKKRASRQQDQHSLSEPSNDGAIAAIQENNCCSQTLKYLPLILEQLNVLTEEIRRNNNLLEKIVENGCKM